MTSKLDSWLRSSEAHWVLDDAVLGCLEQSAAEEIADDFGVSLGELRRAINAALAEGN